MLNSKKSENFFSETASPYQKKAEISFSHRIKRAEIITKDFSEKYIKSMYIYLLCQSLEKTKQVQCLEMKKKQKQK